MFAYGYTTKSKVFLIKHIECRNQTSRYERQKTKKKWTLRVNGNGLNDMVNDMAKITLAHDDDDDDTHTHAPNLDIISSLVKLYNTHKYHFNKFSREP